jgi:hypothetical protein
MKLLCAGQVEMFAPVERVFGTITDIEKWPAWFAGVVSAQQPNHRPLGLNEELHLCMHAGRRRWHETFEVTRLVGCAFLSLEGELSAARRIDIRLEQRSGCTRVGLTIGCPIFGGWFGRLGALFTRGRLRRMVMDSLMHLKHRVEDTSDLPGEIDHHALQSVNVVPLPAYLRAERPGAPIGVA